MKEEFQRSNLLSDKPEELGYIEPGHGAKGRQRWLVEDKDLEEVYKMHQGKKEILLWTYTSDSTDETAGYRKRRSEDEAGGPPTSRSRKDTDDTISEVVEILSKKHESNYSTEQLRVWAHLIQMKKHSSMEVPPDKPFFKSHNVKAPTKPVPASNSPSKMINMRGQCIDQLKKVMI